MAYLSYSQITGTAKFGDAIAENISRKSLSKRNTIFLSHSHHDADIILPVISFLLTLGVEVYVDWLDTSMPSVTSGETATKLKAKIGECDRFLVLLSENSVGSKWVPWELGYADGVKDINKIALLPVRRNTYTPDSTFNGLEYMTLYPVIQEGFLDGKILASIFPPARLGGVGKGYSIDQYWLMSGKVYF
jgi:hypothetical protein